MRHVFGSVLLLTTMTMPGIGAAQDMDQAVANGGIHVSGWMGTVDPQAASQGQTVDNASFAREGDAFHIVTGPSVTYWNPANRATGDYTVSATFSEPAYMNRGGHPHPYGIVIAGSSMGSEQQRYLYCAAYGNGTFIMRGFGPEPFRVNGRRPEANDAINKAAGEGQSVTQEIAVSVRGNTVECSINGTVVGSYDKSAVVGDGMVQSTDGLYGVRFGHNTEGMVSGLSMRKN